MADAPHFSAEDSATLNDAPTDAPIIASLPNAPESTTIAHVDVAVRFRRA
jgi:hypothetical protein